MQTAAGERQASSTFERRQTRDTVAGAVGSERDIRCPLQERFGGKAGNGEVRRGHCHFPGLGYVALTRHSRSLLVDRSFLRSAPHNRTHTLHRKSSLYTVFIRLASPLITTTTSS